MEIAVSVGGRSVQSASSPACGGGGPCQAWWRGRPHAPTRAAAPFVGFAATPDQVRGRLFPRTREKDSRLRALSSLTRPRERRVGVFVPQKNRARARFQVWNGALRGNSIEGDVSPGPSREATCPDRRLPRRRVHRRGRRPRFRAEQRVLDAGLVVDAAGTDQRLPDLVGVDGVVDAVVVLVGDVTAGEEQTPRRRPGLGTGPNLPRWRAGSQCFCGTRVSAAIDRSVSRIRNMRFSSIHVPLS